MPESSLCGMKGGLVSFRVPAGNGEYSFKERHSRFIGIVRSARSQEEARMHLKEIRSQYADATHVCYAWVLGNKGEIQMASDDGEPAHSAGTPILNAIRATKLVWVLVAVVRYYGGTQLGVPGLIEAYGEAARQALGIAGFREEIPRTVRAIRFAYSSVSLSEQLMHRFQAQIISREFGEDCTVVFSIPETEAELCDAALQDVSYLIEVITP